MEHLLADVEEVIARHVADCFATRNRHDLALDLEEGSAICKLDAEAVPGEGQDFLFEHDCLGLLRDELTRIEHGVLA